MKKKITVLTLSAVLIALRLSAEAQQPKKIPRIGLLARISHNGIISRAASPENTFTLDDPGQSALLPRRQTGHWTPIAAIRLCTSR